MRLLCAGFTLLVCAGVQAQTSTNRGNFDIPSLFSNTPPSQLDESLADDDRKVNLSEAYKIKKPDSLRHFEPVAPDSPRLMRPPQPAVNSRKVMELLQRQREWVFLEPNDADFGLTAEDIFNIKFKDPDKQDEESLSPLQKFYQRYHQREGTQTNNVSGVDDGRGPRDAFKSGNLWPSARDGVNQDFPQPYGSDGMYQNDFYPLARPGALDSKSDARQAQEDREKLKVSRALQFQEMLDSKFAIPGMKPVTTVDGAWYESSDPWRFPSSVPSVGSVPVAVEETRSVSPFMPTPGAGGLPGPMPAAPNVSAPSGYTSITPPPPTIQERALDMPKPVFEKPKRKM